jgi:hypothetical protein
VLYLIQFEEKVGPKRRKKKAQKLVNKLLLVGALVELKTLTKIVV